MMFKRFTRAQKGFTLIELLVVIAIIGVLASIVLASLNSARVKGRDARRVSDIKQVQLASELFADANNSEYPDAYTTLDPTFIPTEPTDPTTAAAYSWDNLDNGGAACTIAGGTCTLYHIGANLEEGTNGALDTDGDVCAAAGAGCNRVLAGTTLSGIDGGGATANDCIGAGVGVFCYDVTN